MLNLFGKSFSRLLKTHTKVFGNNHNVIGNDLNKAIMVKIQKLVKISKKL